MTKLFFKYFNILFIAILLIIGLSIYKDFGISIDEKINRVNGLVNLKFLYNFFSFNHLNETLFKNIPDLNSWGDRYYGAFLEVLNILFVEIFLNTKNYSEIYFTRHILNHALFLFSLYFFYLICFNIFKNKYLSYFGVILLYTTPRIFAHSFYNSKDLAFLSIFVIAIYFSIKSFKNLNYRNSLMLALTSALAMNIRIVAIYIPFLFSFFVLIDCLIKNTLIKYKLKYLLIIIFLNIIIFLISYPFLWEEPLKKFLEIFVLFSDFKRMDFLEVFYFGNFYKSSNLPWHYLFGIFFATVPVLITIFGLLGIFFTIKRLVKRLFSIDKDKNYNDIWRSDKEKIILYNFFLIFIPLFASILINSVIYNGWRHFYFLYPLFIIQLIYSLNFLMTYYKKIISNKIIIFFCLVILSNNIFSIIKMHPYQHSYFNILFEKKANQLFQIDYWGVANTDALKKILKLDSDKKVYRVASASFVDLHLSKIMLGEKESKKIVILGQNYDNAEYVFNNFNYEVNTDFDDKYKIPSEFKKFFEIRRGNILINEVYKRKNLNK